MGRIGALAAFASSVDKNATARPARTRAIAETAMTRSLLCIASSFCQEECSSGRLPATRLEAVVRGAEAGGPAAIGSGRSGRLAAARDAHEPGAEGVGDRLGPVLQVELHEDVLDVEVDRVLADPQGRGDLPVRGSLREELEHLVLPLRPP